MKAIEQTKKENKASFKEEYKDRLSNSPIEEILFPVESNILPVGAVFSPVEVIFSPVGPNQLIKQKCKTYQTKNTQRPSTAYPQFKQNPIKNPRH